MSTVNQALREFREKFATMLLAADAVRTAVETEAGVPVDRSRHPRIALVQQTVAAHFGFTVDRMLQRDRHAEVAAARMAAMALCLEFACCGAERIAHDFGGFKHSTVSYAARSIRERAAVDRQFGREFAAAREKVRCGVEEAQRNPLIG